MLAHSGLQPKQAGVKWNSKLDIMCAIRNLVSPYIPLSPLSREGQTEAKLRSEVMGVRVDDQTKSECPLVTGGIEVSSNLKGLLTCHVVHF